MELQANQISTPTHNHLSHDHTHKLPSKASHHSSPTNLQITHSCEQVAILPLESARIVTTGNNKRRISNEFKFINVSQQTRNSPMAKTRIAKIKTLVFRSKPQKLISQQKTRVGSLEQTLMLQRKRRFHKQECVKKMQRLGSPKTIKQRADKKFTRTEDKKHHDNKKFKRGNEKEQPSHQQKLIQAKLIRKLRENQDPQLLSRIPEHMDQNYTSTVMQPSSSPSQLQAVFSQPIQESIIMQPEDQPVTDTHRQ